VTVRTSRALVAVAVALGLLFALASPASADTTYGRDTDNEVGRPPGFDVWQYSADYGPTSVHIAFGLINSNPGVLDGVALTLAFDTNGDNVSDLTASRSAGSAWSLTGRLATAGGPAVGCVVQSGFAATDAFADFDLTFDIPTACLGTPPSFTYRLDATDAIGSEHVPDIAAFTLPVVAGPTTPGAVGDKVRVYRFWNPVAANAHFFTPDERETSHILATDPAWRPEGIAFVAIAPWLADDGGYCQEGRPVFRFYSSVFQSHFWTMDEQEVAQITAHDRNWTWEGVAFCAHALSEQVPGLVPVFRFWSPKFGKHFFTASRAEAEHIWSGADSNWTFEGTAFYAYPAS